MITIPKLVEKDLEVFKDKKAIIYGYELSPEPIYTILKSHNVTVIGCCYEHSPKRNILKDKIKGVPYVSSDKINSLVRDNENVIIQGVDFDEQFIELVEEKARIWGAEYSKLPAGLIKYSFASDAILERYQNFSKFWLKNLLAVRRKLIVQKSSAEKRLASFKQKNPLNPILICSPMKTADHTLNFTFDAINNSEGHIEYINLHHDPTCIDKQSCEKEFGTLKIIMGVRNPIEQNLSQLYQALSSGDYLTQAHGDILNSFFVNRTQALKKLNALPMYNIDDIQVVWDYHVDEIIHPIKCSLKAYKATSSIQAFMGKFNENIIDITAYPFDTEKGYSIIKDGNTEVFVYQLEKLNGLVPELSEWVGVPFDKLENANQTSDKWIAGSYKQAQKELEITQEYFDKCFDEPYVKHCYSNADIEKFKARWRPHIK